MNRFQLFEYWRYRRTAKGRHGVHSPFVYSFVERALRPKANGLPEASGYINETGESFQPDALMQRIMSYFRFAEIILITNSREDIFRAYPEQLENGFYRRLYCFHNLHPMQWAHRFKQEAPAISARDVVSIQGIHNSPAQAAAWHLLRSEPSVRLTIDLFYTGLLFFNEDFKEQQHFVLKYPA